MKSRAWGRCYFSFFLPSPPRPDDSNKLIFLFSYIYILVHRPPSSPAPDAVSVLEPLRGADGSDKALHLNAWRAETSHPVFYQPRSLILSHLPALSLYQTYINLPVNLVFTSLWCSALTFPLRSCETLLDWIWNRISWKEHVLAEFTVIAADSAVYAGIFICNGT